MPSTSAPLHTPPLPPRVSSHREPLGPLPTHEPRPGHPLLHHNKMLVYPRYWTRCERCLNTGYKHQHPSSPCSRCWRKYGREYAGVLRQAYEQTGSYSLLQGVTLQAPLPSATSAVPYTVATSASAPYQQPHVPNRLTDEAVCDEDRYSAAPPRYDWASHAESDQALPQQDYPTYTPPAPHPMYPPMPMPMPAPMPAPMPMPMPPRMGPTIDWTGYGAPPGAVIVQPGDPRIGGVLCPTCGGSGEHVDLFSLFDGNDECDTCGGAGRVPG